MDKPNDPKPDPRQMHIPGPLTNGPELVAAPGPLVIKRVPAHATNYHPTRAAKIAFIVLHSTEGHEGFKQDDNVAHMFSKPFVLPQKPRSAHYVVDSDSVTQCVPDAATAWHCGRSGNKLGLGIELCGTAKQTRLEWLDDLSLPMLAIAARLIADKCREFQLPVRFVNAAALHRGERGITTHAEVAAAWRETNHSDPGVHFPMDQLLAAVATALSKAPGSP